MKEVKIIQFQETCVATLEHWGSPARANETVRTFCQWRQGNSLFPAGGGDTFGIVYDDPETTAPEQFHFDICGSATKPIPENSLGVTTKVIPMQLKSRQGTSLKREGYQLPTYQGITIPTIHAGMVMQPRIQFKVAGNTPK